MASNEEMVVVEGISKSFYSHQRRARVAAVAGVSLRVGRGETYGLIGPDGAGKSTLMRLLNGLYLAEAGRATVKGYDVARHTQQVRRICGYMPQRFALYSDLTVLENVRFFARAYGLSRHDMEERIPRLLRFAGLQDLPRRLAGRLSGGMKKKLALATVLLHEPEVVFLDEPTLGVDPVSRREFWELLSTLRLERRLTIIVCTPYMDEAERCHTIGLIHEGRLIAQDTPVGIRARLPGEMLELRPGAPQAEQLIAAAAGVLEVQTYGPLLRVFVDGAERRAPELERLLRAQGIGVSEMRRSEPGVEEAFIHLLKAESREVRE
jgi:ABC-2 type transport system ATP-binding protein